MKDIRYFALENAVKFNGKANPGAVIGKVLADNPKLKKDMKTLSKQIQEIVKEVNSMSLEEQKARLLEIKPEHYEEEKQKKQKRKE